MRLPMRAPLLAASMSASPDVIMLPLRPPTLGARPSRSCVCARSPSFFLSRSLARVCARYLPPSLFNMRQAVGTALARGMHACIKAA